MQLIDEIESTPRGLYTGAIGWLDRGGDFCLSVAIRTLVVDADGQAARWASARASCSIASPPTNTRSVS